MSLYWLDPLRNRKVSYEVLLERVCERTLVSRYIKQSDPFLVFEELICALVYGVDVTLIDADFSETELKGINQSAAEIAQTVPVVSLHIKSFDDLLKKILEQRKDWRLEIFTSGTTGRPKSVKQSFENLTRSVKTDVRFKNNIWGFSYNPTHFAGLQVFFQGFMNKNAFVYLFDKSAKELPDLIYENNVSRLSCTPTFCRQFISYISKPLTAVKSITFGGEKFDLGLNRKIKEKFPNAKIRNVYASTEVGSILSAEGECFSIPKRLFDFVKISPTNELLIHVSLMGETTNMVAAIDKEWYHSGDLVEVFGENKFKFLSRKSEMINVGGYKVNPLEVEDLIRGVEGVSEVVISARKNSVLGNILVANVIKQTDKDKKDLKMEILNYLKENLQEWKIPRLIKFTQEIEKTRTGKINRS